MDKVLEWAKELQSLAQAGLFYGHDVYDKERYQRIREIAAEMMLTRTDIPAEKIHGLFCNDVGYQTPKVDTRAAIFKDGKILLVKEKGQWSVPGGWCEYNLSPADNVVNTSPRKKLKKKQDWMSVLKRLYLYKIEISITFHLMLMVL